MKTITFWAVLLITVSAGFKAAAQLAITEVMPQSSTNLLTNFDGPDYWELTNFGTNNLNLDGYGFSDDRVDAVFRAAFTNLILRAGESVVFCRINRWVNDADQFRTWWGNDRLPTDLQIRFYDRPGLSPASDEQLWVWDREGQVADAVTLEMSSPGRSWTYDATLGTFGTLSEPGVNGAYRAPTSPDDVGSPGITTGLVRLQILSQPASQTVDGCGSVTFQVLAGGMPRPRYQWTSNAVPILGATSPTLILSRVEPSAAAEYRVTVSNGLEEFLSEPAQLSVNGNPLPPEIVQAPKDIRVFPGQTARFSVEARGFPCVEFQWYSNSVALPGETQSTLSLPLSNAEPLGSTTYSVTAWNGEGTVSASARLLVEPRPQIQITEVMSRPGTNKLALDREDWFELSNFETNAVNLQGYRFRDAASPEVAFVITNAIFIQPGESIICIKSMSRDEFVQWWGADLLPPQLQVVTWEGWGLGIGNPIYLWNAHPSQSLDTVASAAPLGNLDGVSEEFTNTCDPDFGCIATHSRDSVEGELGAFRAAQGGDIGSPGCTANPPPRCLSVERANSNLIMRWRVISGKTYRFYSKEALRDADWTLRDTKVADGYVLTWTDLDAVEAPTRYYRLEELP